MGERLRRTTFKTVTTLGTLGTLGTALANCFVFELETGQLAQIKIGALALYDRRRAEARRARRRARRDLVSNDRDGPPPSAAPEAPHERNAGQSD
jgi:hypothetical protein